MGSSNRGGPLPRRGFSCAVYLQEPRAWYFGLVWWHLVLPLMLLSTGGPGDPTCPCINATALLIGLSSLSVIPRVQEAEGRCPRAALSVFWMHVLGWIAGDVW